MSKNLKILVPIAIITGVVIVIGAVVIVSKMPEKPLTLQAIEEKLNSIIVPKPLIGTLTPARDLKGTWKSSLASKGIELFGRIEAGDSITTLHENGDVELIIESVADNVAYGQFRFTNLCVNSLTTAPNIKPISLKQCTEDTGYQPVTIKISGSALDFGTITVEGATITTQGSYTTDIMTGTMSVTMPEYGVIKGTVHLFRQK
jgi:hypothetical protein